VDDDNNSKHGGGILNVVSSPAIINCKLINNSAESFGGAIFNILATTVNIINCIFNNNKADWGGAIANVGSSGSITAPISLPIKQLWEVLFTITR
jgi:hypothetical protein